MVINKKQALLVMGMHRSGTSALTRALKVFNVRLGDNLLPPVKGHNDKGYWEDVTFNAINIELLFLLGSDFHLLYLSKLECFTSPKFDNIKEKAKLFILEKFAESRLIGLKDPRTCLTLSFWNVIFNELGVNVKYILALRNPESAAKSFMKPHGFAKGKCLMLWAAYNFNFLKKANTTNSLIVSYENLIDNPQSQLNRISTFLNIPLHDKSDKSDKVDEYCNIFLDPALQRNQVSGTEELQNLSPLLHELYRHLIDCSEIDTSLKSKIEPSLLNSIERLLTGFEDSWSFFELYERGQANLKNKLEEANNKQEVQKCYIHYLDKEIDSQKKVIVTQKSEICSQEKTIVTQKSEICSQEKTIATQKSEVEIKITELIKELKVQDKQHKFIISKLKEDNNKLINSWSWRLTLPMRKILYFLLKLR